jgi:hypothetical protein
MQTIASRSSFLYHDNHFSIFFNEAKWNIVDIFIDNLDTPFFINENTSN